MRLSIATWLIAIAALIGGPNHGWAGDRIECDQLLPSEASRAVHGPVTPEELAALRDIGGVYLRDFTHPLLVLSPDRRSIAFQLHRAYPSENRYCAGLVVLQIAPRSRPLLVDISHEVIQDRPPSYGWAAFPVGVPKQITPRWAPNGQWIAYLKREGGSTQVWRVDIASGKAGPVTHSKVDVDDFRISVDGRTIVYSARLAIRASELAIDREGLTGWRYDVRALPARGARPQTPDAVPDYRAIDLESGAERAASDAETLGFAPPMEVSENAATYAVGPAGRVAWTEPSKGVLYPPQYNLIVREHSGDLRICPAPLCKADGLTALWWTGDGTRLRFSLREGWAKSQTAIYEWIPGSATRRRIYQSGDALIECGSLANDLICLRERAREPRHIVRLKLGNGEDEMLFDPNPEFSGLTMGRVERLQWRNGFNVPFFGDLVYPVDFQAGRRFPLMIVQYRTRGFLRGSVGDEVPIQAFANHGYFVLSLDKSEYETIVGRQKSATELNKAYLSNFTGRRHILSAIEIVVRNLIERGFVDKNRVGITGLSDGSTTAQYAAINSGLFAAGSLSGCCWEPMQDASLGPMISQGYHGMGWPRMVDDDPSFWSQISLMTQPRRVRFPILFQAAENEYFAVAGSYTALSEAGIPTDLYIFPNEDHIKWQPAHRLAVYRRNLTWFDFWLKDVTPHDPGEQREVERWKEMKERWRTMRKGNVD